MVRRMRRAVKGVSPVLATMILIVIAVVSGLIIYAWIMGWVGGQKARSVALGVRVIRVDEDTYNVEIKNTGGVSVTITKVTVTDPDEDVHINTTSITLAVGEVTTFETVPKTGNECTETVGTEVTVTVTTSEAGDLTYKAVVE